MQISTVGELRKFLEDIPDYYSVLDGQDVPIEIFISPTAYGTVRVVTTDEDCDD